MREGRRGAAVPREARAEARRAPARAEAATGAVRNRAAASDMVDARVGSGRGESEKAHAADVSLRVVTGSDCHIDGLQKKKTLISRSAEVSRAKG